MSATEAGLEDLDVDQLRQLAEMQAKRLVHNELLLRRLGPMADAPLLNLFLATVMRGCPCIRFTTDVLQGAGTVSWTRTADGGFVVWVDERPTPKGDG